MLGGVPKLTTSTRLGELERAVMEYLWSVAPEPATVRNVHDHLAQTRTLAYTTVMTVLGRMAIKGTVEQIRDGRAYRYRPAITRDELTAALMHDALDTVDTRDRAAALVRFIDGGSAQDLDVLRSALADLERRVERSSPGWKG